MTNAHRFCDTQPTTSFALLRIQLMMPGNASVAFTPNFPSSDAKALSLFLSHSFRFSGLPPPLPWVVAPPPLESNASTRTLIAIPMAIKTEVIVMPCSLNSILIFLANEVFCPTLSKSSLVVGESTLKEIDAFLPDFQVVIQRFSPILDVFSNAIIMVWVVPDLEKLTLFPLDAFFQLNLFLHLYWTLAPCLSPKAHAKDVPTSHPVDGQTVRWGPPCFLLHFS